MKAYQVALSFAVLAVGTCEWRTDEPTVTLAVLAALSGGLGALRPRLFWLSGLAVGSVVAILNLFTVLTGIRPGYEPLFEAKSHGAAYDVSLAVLVVPALVAAAIGAAVRTLASRSSGDNGAAAR
jgi:hypothetical protein